MGVGERPTHTYANRDIDASNCLVDAAMADGLSAADGRLGELNAMRVQRPRAIPQSSRGWELTAPYSIAMVLPAFGTRSILTREAVRFVWISKWGRER